MNRFQTFQQFLANQSVQVDPLNFAINLILTALLTAILAAIYTRYGNALSNRAAFGKNLVLLAMITMTVISIVKSSLALSLGLVGALSIVRFRAAIKEPEELIFLFLAIAIGLGFGADQRYITLIAFVFISIAIIVRNIRRSHKAVQSNIYVTVRNPLPDEVSLAAITGLMGKHCEAVELKRYDQRPGASEVVYAAKLESFTSLESLRQDLASLNEDIQITFLDQTGITD